MTLDALHETPPLLARSRGLSHWGFERVGSVAALVVVGIVAAILVATQLISAAVVTPVPSRPLATGTEKSIGEGSGRFTLDVPAGWSEAMPSEGTDELTLVRPGVTTAIAARTEVRDAQVYYDRQIRDARIAGLSVTPGAVSTSSASDGTITVTGTFRAGDEDRIQTVMLTTAGNALLLVSSTPAGGLSSAGAQHDRLVDSVVNP